MASITPTAPTAKAGKEDIPTLLSGLGKLFEPTENIYKQQVAEAAAGFQPIDPKIVQTMVADGGPLSTYNDFANSGAWALTPENMKTMLSLRPNAMEDVAKAAELSDLVYQNRAKAKLKADMATKQFEAANSRFNTGLNFGANREQNQTSANVANANNQTHLTTTGMQIASAQKIAAERERTLRNQIKAYRDAATAGMNTTPGTTANPALLGQLEQRLSSYGVLNSKKSGKFNFGNVSDQNLKPALTTYLQSEIARGLPYNQIYDVKDERHQKALGYPQLILGVGGWHGIYTGKDGKQYATDLPVVPYRATPPKVGAGAGATNLYHGNMLFDANE